MQIRIKLASKYRGFTVYFIWNKGLRIFFKWCTTEDKIWNKYGCHLIVTLHMEENWEVVNFHTSMKVSGFFVIPSLGHGCFIMYRRPGFISLQKKVWTYSVLDKDTFWLKPGFHRPTNHTDERHKTADYWNFEKIIGRCDRFFWSAD